MLRWLTAGESHGPALVAILEGLPAGVAITTADVGRSSGPPPARATAAAPGCPSSRTRSSSLGGVRHGRTQGGPVAIRIGNTEWPKWEQVMSRRPGRRRRARRAGPQRAADPAAARATPTSSACRSTASTTPGRCSSGPAPARPRPGSRSARSRRRSCAQALGVAAGQPRRRDRHRRRRPRACCPGPTTSRGIDADPVRCLDPATSAAMVAEIDAAARTATPSAASSRCSPTACRRAWAATCTGTAGSTPGWPAR